MKVLGLHDGHNATAAFVVDGEVTWVIQEERPRREKNFDGFPEMAVKHILEAEGLTPSDIDVVVLNGNHQPTPMTRMERLDAFANLSKGGSAIKSTLKNIKKVDQIYRSINNTNRIKNCVNLGFAEEQIKFIEHHKAHAAAAYYAFNKFDEPVLVLTNDGAGDRICATVSVGKEGKLERIYEVSEDSSIGLLYAMYTFLTGMVPLEHEYKIMGMAPYADQKGARKVADEFHAMFEVTDEGLGWRFTKGKSIYQSLGFFNDFMYLKRFDHLMAGLQLFIEEFLSNWVEAAIKKTGIRKIALSGGTFMNVKANKVIMELDSVDELFVFPSCGDESNSIGAAYEYLANSDNYKSIKRLDHVYFGVDFSGEQIQAAFNAYSFKSKYEIEYFSDIESLGARLLADGHVVARFKGKEEFGARSLGNRAIMGNPSSSNVIKVINEMIKNRDFWMPFASSIIDTDIDRYVQMNEKNNPYYMIMTYDTKEAANEIIGGIHPYDRTVRPQLVTKEHNEDYWNLINEFKKLTGIGGILNTSLNLHGLPLVHKPEDAFEVLDKSDLKYLLIGDYLVSKVS